MRYFARFHLDKTDTLLDNGAICVDRKFNLIDNQIRGNPQTYNM